MREKKTYKKNQKFGDWVLTSFLGSGGNGEVWRCEGLNGGIKAIKILKKVRPKSYDRFLDEITVLGRNSDVIGIIPLVDKFLPENPTASTPYYVMELGTPYHSILPTLGIEARVGAILQVGETLEELHTRSIFHRDIKPANILYYKDRFCLADFGLVDYPNKKDVSHLNEEIGAKWTMAPEMRRQSSTADPAKADVYSLAKTLWIFLTGIEKSFDGQYSTESIIDLRSVYPRAYTAPIDDLLFRSTDNDPTRRPTISEFVRDLKYWTELSKNFHDRNHQQWFEIQTKLFPTSIPSRVVWESLEDIIKVLKLVCRYDNLNHVFFPRGGGLDLCDARLSFEEDCLELDFQLIHIVRPIRFVFESFNYNPEWNYFRLEAGGLTPVSNDVVKKVVKKPDVEMNVDLEERKEEEVEYAYEELSELSPGEYYPYDILKNRQNYKEDYLFTKESRHVKRWLKGSFVIFGKRSIYNLIPSTYDGRHSTMSNDEFRKYIQDAVNALRERENPFIEDRHIAERERDEREARKRSMIKEGIVYRCGWCGNIVSQDGSELDNFTMSYNIKVINKFGDGVVRLVHGNCCKDKWY